VAAPQGGHQIVAHLAVEAHKPARLLALPGGAPKAQRLRGFFLALDRFPAPECRHKTRTLARFASPYEAVALRADISYPRGPGATKSDHGGLNRMARKKATQSAANEPQSISVRVVLDAVDESAVYYANYAEASLGNHECLLSFARVPTKMNIARTEEAKSGVLRLEPLVQIIVPPTLLPGLIRALTVTKDGYEKTIGSIKEPDAPE
jgi:hypothetical protein